MSKYVLAYGTLRVGQNNFWHYFGDSKHIKTITLDGFDMYTRGGYPVIIEGSGSIVCDLLEVTDGQFNRANLMEVGAGYTPRIIGVSGKEEIEAYLWVYDPLAKMIPIKDGDWVEYINVNRDTRNERINQR